MAQLEKKRRDKGEPGGKPKLRGSVFGSGWRAWWPLLIPVACAVVAYHDALHGEFVFDDVPAIADNANLETVGGFWDAAFGPQHSPISNRPVVCLSFALNYAWSGRNPFGFHLVNLLIHAANSALLAAVVRRTLTAPNLGESFTPKSATWTATAVAVVWSVHPLTVDAVTYLTQRTTLLMSFFILLTFYATLRSATEPVRTAFWSRLGVLFCALAMMSKEEAAALPILVMLFDRAYLFESFAAARARRFGYYFALATTWLLLLACVIAGPKNSTVGYDAVPHLSAWEWLLTEARVLVHYLRLTFWPRPLIAAYDWDFVRQLGDVWRQGLLILSLLGLTVFLGRRKPHWGWLGWMFFLLLAPTSSVMPIVTEQIAERRMYLPMLAVLIPVVLGLAWLAQRLTPATLGPAPKRLLWTAVPVAAVAFVEARETARYASVFNNSMSLWTDVQSKNELTNGSFASGDILLGIAKPWLDRGRYDVALPLLERAVQCDEPDVDILTNLADAYVDVGDYAKAQAMYQRAFAKDPNYPNALSNYAKLLLDLYTADPPEKRLGSNDPRLHEAYEKITRALRYNNRAPFFYNNLGSVCFYMERFQEAEGAWRRALQLDPKYRGAEVNLAIALAAINRKPEALAILEKAHNEDPLNPSVLSNVVELHLQMGNRAAALQRVQRTLQLDKNHPTANALLKSLTQSGG